MIRAIIIDDEQHCIDRLTRLIEENTGPKILLMDVFMNIDEGLKGIKRLQPELVFLDVQIHDRTGFDLLQALPEINFEIIFTTAFEKFAVQAFKFSAVDYLLKPIDADDLQAALLKLDAKLAVGEKAKKFENLIHNVRNDRKRICVSTLNGYIYLFVDDIIRCESDVNYTNIFLRDHSKLLVSKTLKDFEDLLADHGFFRVHNSHLINTTLIKAFNKGKGGYVTLTDDSQIEVSVRRKDEFMKYLEERNI